jgi:hypothetical protein
MYCQKTGLLRNYKLLKRIDIIRTNWWNGLRKEKKIRKTWKGKNQKQK